MPTYRVEESPNNRAGCQDGVCKKEGEKIKKGEIRFGTWIEGSTGDGREFQSWKWRHWGCVSGKTLQNIRENLSRDGGEGQYDWDYMDGLEEMPPSLQNKVKTAIIEGKIADEDWKGDPEYNVLGKTGIRGRASAKKKGQEHEEDGAGEEETPSKPPTKKRARAKKEDDSEEEGTPVKKKRATKAKKEDESETETKPVKKPRVKKAAEKKEVDAVKSTEEIKGEIDVDAKPAKKSRVKKAIQKDEDEKPVKLEAENEVKPAKNSKAKKVVVKKEEGAKSTKTNGEATNEAEEKPTKQSRPKKVIKKEESIEEPDKNEVDVKPTKKARAKKVVKVEEVNEGSPTGAKKPDDPLEQIAQGYCDENGPLMKEFKEMVDAHKVDDDDWGEFLQIKFGSMVLAGELTHGDWSRFLQQMHDREVATMQSHVDTPKKDVKAKKVTGAAAGRGRKAKAT